MACPYFFPLSPDPHSSNPAHAMLPLGDAWSGECRAVPDAPWEPGVETLYAICNIGYARARCPRFPVGDAPDAIRFSVRTDDGQSLDLYYVVERDHLPVDHGPLRLTEEGRAIQPSPPNAAVDRLARAYAASYHRRKAEASRP